MEVSDSDNEEDTSPYKFDTRYYTPQKQRRSSNDNEEYNPSKPKRRTNYFRSQKQRRRSSSTDKQAESTRKRETLGRKNKRSSQTDSDASSTTSRETVRRREKRSNLTDSDASTIRSNDKEARQAARSNLSDSDASSIRKTEKEARQQARLLERDERLKNTAPFQQMAHIAECSISMSTMNTSRLQHCNNIECTASGKNRVVESPFDDAERQRVEADSMRDIHEYGDSLSSDSMKEMHKDESEQYCDKVCAACGKRDPRDKYHLRELGEIKDDNWLLASTNLVSKLKEKKVNLLRENSENSDALDTVSVSLIDFYHIYERYGIYYHMLPEAVRDDSDFFLCKSCNNSFKKSVVQSPWSFYNDNAPPKSLLTISLEDVKHS